MAGGNLTDLPSSMTYVGVVSHYSVSLDFLIVELNYLDILAGDIQNVYLNTTAKEKLSFYTDYEWKYYQGKVVIFVRSLYGLDHSALSWRNHLSEILGNHLGFQSYLGDPNVWFKVATYKIWNKYYTYILLYVHDLIIVDKDPRKCMDMLESKYMVKLSSIGETKVYLGADVGTVLYGDGSYAWKKSSD